MAKLKPILPTLREKKRYLAFEVVSKGKIKAHSDVSRAIWQGMLSFSGTKGAARAGIQVLPEKYNDKRQCGIVRVNHKNVDALKASIALVKEIDAVPVSIRSIGVSGSIKKATLYVAG
jgi:ribonuclease P/MRP protein subunit POP5